MEKNNKLILNVLGYLVVFIAVQFVVSLVALYLGDSIKYPPSASAKALTLSSAHIAQLHSTKAVGCAGVDHIGWPGCHTSPAMAVRADEHHHERRC